MMIPLITGVYIRRGIRRFRNGRRRRRSVNPRRLNHGRTHTSLARRNGARSIGFRLGKGDQVHRRTDRLKTYGNRKKQVRPFWANWTSCFSQVRRRRIYRVTRCSVPHTPFYGGTSKTYRLPIAWPLISKTRTARFQKKKNPRYADNESTKYIFSDFVQRLPIVVNKNPRTPSLYSCCPHICIFEFFF